MNGGRFDASIARLRNREAIASWSCETTQGPLVVDIAVKIQCGANTGTKDQSGGGDEMDLDHDSLKSRCAAGGGKSRLVELLLGRGEV